MLVTECEWACCLIACLGRALRAGAAVGVGVGHVHCCTGRVPRALRPRFLCPCAPACLRPADCEGGNLSRNIVAGKVSRHRRGRKVRGGACMEALPWRACSRPRAASSLPRRHPPRMPCTRRARTPRRLRWTLRRGWCSCTAGASCTSISSRQTSCWRGAWVRVLCWAAAPPWLLPAAAQCCAASPACPLPSPRRVLWPPASSALQGRHCQDRRCGASQDHRTRVLCRDGRGRHAGVGAWTGRLRRRCWPWGARPALLLPAPPTSPRPFPAASPSARPCSRAWPAVVA